MILIIGKFTAKLDGLHIKYIIKSGPGIDMSAALS